jgi:hypothetical protein
MKSFRIRKIRRPNSPGDKIRRFVYLSAVWAAVLLQAHIFLVLQLHQHRAALNLVAKSQQASSIASNHTELRSVSPFCPACRVARQGFVHAAVDVLDGLPLPLVDWAPRCPTFQLSIAPFLQLSGRDPPQC